MFMPIEHFADTFDFEDGRFSGFLSDTKIKDIDESNIATTITIRDITKWQTSSTTPWLIHAVLPGALHIAISRHDISAHEAHHREK